MKFFLLTLFFIILLGLSGCGSSEKTTAKLQITHAFAMTNPYFGGGLIIKGRNLSNGKTFSQGITSSTEFRTTLDKGNWIISAIGWDGGATNTNFAGTPYCGIIQKNLISNSEVVNLSVTAEKCSEAYFSAGNTELLSGTSTYTFKKISLINTCKTFFKEKALPTATISSTFVNSATTDEFCESLPQDLKSDVSSVKIYSNNKNSLDSYSTLGFSSPCITSNTAENSVINPAATSPANPYVAGTDLRLPFGGASFSITIFDNSDCSSPITSFSFSDGLHSGNPNLFDHMIVGRPGGGLRLLLPSNKTRRARSSFHALMPAFLIGTAPASPFVVEPASISNFQFRGFIGTNNRIVLKDVSTCDTITSSAEISTTSCSDLGERVQINFTGASAGSATLTMSGVTYNLLIEDNSTTGERYQAQRIMLDLLGHTGNENLLSFFKLPESKIQNEKMMGAMTVIRKIFSSDGAGALFEVPLNIGNTTTFGEQCAALADGSKDLSIFNYEKLINETYTAVLSSISEAPLKFICNNTNMNPSTCSGALTYTKLLTIYQAPNVDPVITLKFNCDNLMGTVKLNLTDENGAHKTVSNEIINWNTYEGDSSLLKQRFEILSWFRTYSNDSLIDDHRMAARMTKTGVDTFEAWAFLFDSFLSNSNQYDQKLTYSRFRKDSDLYYLIDQKSELNSATPLSIFSSAINGIPTFLLIEPTSELPESKFLLTGSYPQSIVNGTYATFSPLSANFSNTDQFDGSLTFKVDSLNPSGTFETLLSP